MSNINIYNLEPSDSLVDLDEQEDVVGGYSFFSSYFANITQTGVNVNAGNITFGGGTSSSTGNVNQSNNQHAGIRIRG